MSGPEPFTAEWLVDWFYVAIGAAAALPGILLFAPLWIPYLLVTWQLKRLRLAQRERDFERAEASFNDRPGTVTRLQQAAYHEAGHVVMAAIFGVPIKGALAGPRGAGLALMSLDAWLEQQPTVGRAVQVVLVNLAGPLLEAKVACADVAESHASAMSDFRAAWLATQSALQTPLVAVSAATVLRPTSKATITLLAECRQTIEQLKDLLVARRFVDAATIRDITKHSVEITRMRARVSRTVWIEDLIDSMDTIAEEEKALLATGKTTFPNSFAHVLLAYQDAAAADSPRCA